MSKLFYVSGVKRGPYGGNDEFTKLLMHMEGADGSTSFIDSSKSAHTPAANDNAQIDTAQAKFGGASGLFDGSGAYVSIETHDDWIFGTGDFTIDFWARFNSIDGDQSFFGRDDNGAADRMAFSKESDGTSWFLYNIGGLTNYRANYVCTPGYQAGQWYHLAVVRNGTNFFIFVNGVAQSLTVNNAIGSNDLAGINDGLKVGRSFYNGTNHYMNGWIDEFRVSKGIARWTSNFTPPERAYR